MKKFIRKNEVNFCFCVCFFVFCLVLFCFLFRLWFGFVLFIFSLFFLVLFLFEFILVHFFVCLVVLFYYFVGFVLFFLFFNLSEFLWRYLITFFQSCLFRVTFWVYVIAVIWVYFHEKLYSFKKKKTKKKQLL